MATSKRRTPKRAEAGAAERAIETAVQLDRSAAQVDQRLSALEAAMKRILSTATPALPSTRPMMAPRAQQPEPSIMDRLATLEIGLEAATAQTITFAQRCQKLEEALYGEAPQGSAG